LTSSTSGLTSWAGAAGSLNILPRPDRGDLSANTRQRRRAHRDLDQAGTAKNEPEDRKRKNKVAREIRRERLDVGTIDRNNETKGTLALSIRQHQPPRMRTQAFPTGTFGVMDIDHADRQHVLWQLQPCIPERS